MITERAAVDELLLARFKACVGEDRSVLIDPEEQAELALELLASAPLRQVREEPA